MKEGIICTILTVCGFAAGFGTGYAVVRAKYNAKVMAEAEAEGKKISQEKKEEEILKEASKAELPKNDPNMVERDDNVIAVRKEEKEEEQDEEEEEEYEDLGKPEFIDEEEMELYPFDNVEALFYFDDCALTDMHYNALDNYEENIGVENYLLLDSMTKNAASGAIFWVVNEKEETFYKIIVKHKTFASVKASLTVDEDDEDGESY